ncbi:MAG TPA: ISLre2 family transposase [Limnochordales bacterium]
MELGFILPGEIRSFKQLEQFLLQAVLAMVRDLVEAAVRKLDGTLPPPGGGWESVGYKTRRITGLLGVEYRLQRRMYRRRRPDGTWEECCPLDERLGLAARERFSPGVREWAVELATRHPFRVAAAILAESGTPVSHQSIHRWVQEAGAAREAEQRQAVEAIERTGEVPAGEGRGAAAVICEVDGMWVALQREAQRRWEFKLGVLHEGWEVESPAGRRYRLKGKLAWGGDLETEAFWARGFWRFAARYDPNRVGRRVGNSDGAAWAKEGRAWLGIEEWHLDPFHRNAALERALGWNTRRLRRAQQAARRGDWATLVRLFAEAQADPDCPVSAAELQAVRAYLEANRDGLDDWRQRRGPLPEPARGLGATEPSVRHVLADRLKGKAAWTRRGAHHMAQLRCLRYEGQLKAWLARWTAGSWPERPAQPVLVRLARKVRRGLLETDPQAWLRAHVPMLSHPDARQTATGLALRRCLAWAAPWGARV